MTDFPYRPAPYDNGYLFLAFDTLRGCLDDFVIHDELFIEQHVFRHALNQIGDVIEELFTGLVFALLDLRRNCATIATADSFVQKY